jgi:hypothetical protein
MLLNYRKGMASLCIVENYAILFDSLENVLNFILQPKSL